MDSKKSHQVYSAVAIKDVSIGISDATPPAYQITDRELYNDTMVEIDLGGSRKNDSDGKRGENGNCCILV